MIFCQYLLRNVTYYSLFGQFLVPLPGSRKKMFPRLQKSSLGFRIITILLVNSCCLNLNNICLWFMIILTPDAFFISLICILSFFHTIRSIFFSSIHDQIKLKYVYVSVNLCNQASCELTENFRQFVKYLFPGKKKFPTLDAL